MAFQTLNSSNLYYPTALCPKVIEDIQTGMPPEPSLALLNLPSEPARPVPETPPIFRNNPPQRCDYTLLGLGTFIAMVVSAFSIEAGLLLFCLIAGFSAWELLTFPSRQNAYRQSVDDHNNNINKINYAFAEQQKQYKDKMLFHQKQCKEIEAENQKRRQAHSRICAQLHTPEKVAAWRQSQLQTVVVRPTSLGDEVNTTQFDPRGYPEFESNSRFPGMLRNYFSGKIYSLRRLNGYIPDFAYVDDSKNLSIVIDINEPYTPRQYPNSNGYLKLLHCLGQDNNRLRTFQSDDWFVLLFSERQTLQYPMECCKEVARLIDSYTGSNLVQTRFSNVGELEPEPHWDEAMAETMAEQQARLRYKRSYGYDNNRYLSREQTEALLMNLMGEPTNPTPQTSQNFFRGNLLFEKQRQKARKKIRYKFRKYLQKYPELSITENSKKQFVESLLDPKVEGIAGNWVRTYGVEEGISLLENCQRGT
jgi:hypothetical protein